MNDAWLALRNRPRLMVSIGCTVAAAILLPGALPSLARVLTAWDIGTLVFLVLSAVVFSRASTTTIPDISEAQEAGEWTVFAFTVMAVAASFIAVIGEFSVSKDAVPSVRNLHVALVAATLLLSWFSTHTIFALRYAHEFYDRNAEGSDYDRGLDFPGEKNPDYWDFFYFSIVLGMTFQVSDVQISSRKLRRLATVHGVLSFMFNTVIIALTVNIGAGLL